MSSLYYSKEHVWIRPSSDGWMAMIGLSNFATDQMAGIVYADLGISQRVVKRGDEMGIVESTKAVESIVCPFDCKVIAVNDISGEALNERSEEPENWLYKVNVEDPEWRRDLMDSDAYRKYVNTMKGAEEDEDTEPEAG